MDATHFSDGQKQRRQACRGSSKVISCTVIGDAEFTNTSSAIEIAVAGSYNAAAAAAAGGYHVSADGPPTSSRARRTQAREPLLCDYSSKASVVSLTSAASNASAAASSSNSLQRLGWNAATLSSSAPVFARSLVGAPCAIMNEASHAVEVTQRTDFTNSNAWSQVGGQSQTENCSTQPMFHQFLYQPTVVAAPLPQETVAHLGHDRAASPVPLSTLHAQGGVYDSSGVGRRTSRQLRGSNSADRISCPLRRPSSAGEINTRRSCSSRSFAVQRGPNPTNRRTRSLPRAMDIETSISASPLAGSAPWPRALSAASLSEAAAVAFAAEQRVQGTCGIERAPSAAQPQSGGSSNGTKFMLSPSTCLRTQRNVGEVLGIAASPPRRQSKERQIRRHQRSDAASRSISPSRGSGLAASQTASCQQMSIQVPCASVVREEPLRESLVDVFLRIRPPDPREHGEIQCIRATRHGVYVDDPACPNGHWFEFEGVVDSCSSLANGGQEEVFGLVGTQVVKSVQEGYHTCVFSMGQTGTGKTYTLMGIPGAPGLLPAIVDRLLETPKRIRLSCLELHMDKLRDLLAEDSNLFDRPMPEVRCIPQRGVYVSNLSEVAVEDSQAALKLMQLASRQRIVSRTGMNAVSSRGHAVFQLTVEDSGARLCIVDLAGRENERTTRCQGQSLAELGYINKSLFHLTNVIQALARPKSPRNLVPFRNSKLTLLLSECLQSARSSLIATVSPAISSLDETLTTLRLSQAVRQITTRSRRSLARRSDEPVVAHNLARGSVPPPRSLSPGSWQVAMHQALPRGVGFVGSDVKDNSSLCACAPEPSGVPIPFAPRLLNHDDRYGFEFQPRAAPRPHSVATCFSASAAQRTSAIVSPIAATTASNDVAMGFSSIQGAVPSVSSEAESEEFAGRPSRLAAWKSSSASLTSHTTAGSHSRAPPGAGVLEVSDSDRDADILDEHIFQVIQAPRWHQT